MFDEITLLTFVISSVLITLTPGPDNLFTLTQGATYGKKAGVMTALGLATGNLVHTLWIILGFSLILKSNIFLFSAFKVIGCAYLFYLAYQNFKTRKTSFEFKEQVAEHSLLKLYFKGIFLNVINPKVAVFFLTYLPGYVNPETGSINLQIFILGVIFTIQVVIVFGTLAFFAGFLEKN